MKLSIEMVDGFLMSVPGGKTTTARVARVRWQKAVRQPYTVANIIVESDKPSVVVQMVAAYLKEKGQ